MSEPVKIRLKMGNREIEAEGPHSIVDSLLEKWWKIAEAERDNTHDHGHAPTNNIDGDTVDKPRQKPKRHAAASKPDADDSFDPQELINRMREDENYSKFETKILHTKDRANKVKFVSWFAKVNLTSGDIHKVLQGLGVKLHLSGVSTAIKSNQKDFLQDGKRTKGAITRYKLTSQAEKAFDAWLMNNE